MAATATVIAPIPMPEVSLTDGDVYVRYEQHAAWRRLRAEAPVSWHEGAAWFPGFWSVTKHADVLTISKDPHTFISSRGIAMAADPNATPEQSGAGVNLITTDPPRHVRMRRLVNKGFTPRMVSKLEPMMAETTKQIFDEIADPNNCDFVTEVAARLPLAVICSMVGAPVEDWPFLFTLTNQALGSGDPEYRTEGRGQRATAAHGQQQMFQYFTKIIADRRRERRDDLVSVLVDAEIDGEQLSEVELLNFCFLLIVAGNETTRNAISGGLLALLENPGEMAKLRAQPSLLPLAVEEILRYTSPLAHMARTATRDYELRGQLIREGDRVLMWYASANRDEEVFADPDRFDIGRSPNDHLAFGFGEHFCLGAGLARFEIRVLFETLLARYSDIALIGPVERLRSTFLTGIKHLPISLTLSRES